jgi:hypothetical protein
MFVRILTKTSLYKSLTCNISSADTFAHVITWVPGYGEIILTPKLSSREENRNGNLLRFKRPERAISLPNFGSAHSRN